MTRGADTINKHSDRLVETETKLPIINLILILIYICFMVFTYIFMNITDQFSACVLFSLIITIALTPSVYVFLVYLREFSLKRKKMNIGSTSGTRIVFLIYGLIVFFIELIWYLAYRPGCFGSDNTWQFRMVVEGPYNDWHPVWHTLVIFALPLKLFGSTGAIVFLQIVYFSLAIGYMGYVISKHAGTWASVIAVGLIAINPFVSKVLMFPLKDVAFGIAGLVALTMAIDGYLDREKQDRKIYWGLFGFVAANATLFRHNAVLFTIPLVIAVLCNVPQGKKRYIILSFIMTIGIIRFPVYKLLNVQKPQSRVVETMGLPLTVIGNVAKEEPEKMDEELAEFVYSIAPQKRWNEMTLGSFNSIKWSGTDWNAIEEAKPVKILHMMAKSFVLAPRAALRSFIAVTDMIYGLDTGTEGNALVDKFYNEEYGMTYCGNETIKRNLENYAQLFTKFPLLLFRTYGVFLLALLLILFSKVNIRSWTSWKKALCVSPIFVYDFGTMLFLAGDDTRFFWITFLVVPIMVVFLLVKKEQRI